MLNALFSSSLISHQRRTKNFCFREFDFEDLFLGIYIFRDDFSNVMPITFVKYRDIYNYNQLKIYLSIFYLVILGIICLEAILFHIKPLQI